MNRRIKRLARPLSAGIFILIYMAGTNLLFGQVCPLKITVGLPCPGCGMTRAARLLLTGHVAESVAMHPLLLPLAAVCALWALLRLWKPETAGRWVLPLIVAMALLLFLVYFCRLRSGFGEPPLDVNPNSFFHQVLPSFHPRTS